MVFFYEESISIESWKQKANKLKASFVSLTITSDRQAGDIAGTKLKRAAEHLIKVLELNFKIIKSNFSYEEGREAVVLIMAKTKGEHLRKGPPNEMKKHVAAFKKEHPEAFLKKGIWYAYEAKVKTLDIFFRDYYTKYKNKLNSMGVTSLEVRDKN